jgi:DNA modification methylase
MNKLPKPYYQDDLVTIYHGDCAEIVPQIGRFDLLLTDPPYGIGKSGQKMSVCKNPKHNRKHHDDFGWDDSAPDISFALASCDNHVIWGGNYFSGQLPPSMGWIVWDKGQRINQSDCELAYTSFQSALRSITVNRAEIMADGSVHPTQKPEKVIRFSLNYAMQKAEIQNVLDPFMGSGTTLAVCRREGIRSVGIDREEKYCDIARQRVQQRSLFEENE